MNNTIILIEEFKQVYSKYNFISKQDKVKILCYTIKEEIDGINEQMLKNFQKDDYNVADLFSWSRTPERVYWSYIYSNIQAFKKDLSNE